MIPRALAFLFTRPQSEELAAEHVIREHHRGRVLTDILHDPYLTDRCTHEQIVRLLDRPEILHAIGDDVVAEHRTLLSRTSAGQTRAVPAVTSARPTQRPRVVVVGAGVAALEFVLALAELAPDRAGVELIAPDDHFMYRPGAVAETFGIGEPFRLDLGELASHARVRRFRTRIVSVDHVDLWTHEPAAT